MSYALNNIATADRYDDARTLRCPGGRTFSIDVHNAAIYYQFGTSPAGTGVTWEATEHFLAPTFRSMDRRYDAVRVRSAAAGVPAFVTVSVAASDDLGGPPRYGPDDDG